MTAPEGYILVPQQAWSIFVAIVTIACILEIAFRLAQWWEKRQ